MEAAVAEEAEVRPFAGLGLGLAVLPPAMQIRLRYRKYFWFWFSSFFFSGYRAT